MYVVLVVNHIRNKFHSTVALKKNETCESLFMYSETQMDLG